MSENIIVIENLTKKFSTINVLNNINLEMQKGKIHGLIGRNGSGKTMLLKCMCGFVLPSSGKIFIDNKLVGKDIDIPENVGAIIESPGFLPSYDAFSNLKFLSMIKNKVGKDQIMDIIKKVGLDPTSKKVVGKFSLGMRQRLGIAQALMENPEILILDEPMNGLDNKGVEEIRNLLMLIREEGRTIVLASHSKEDIEILCDFVYEMDSGEVINTTIKEQAYEKSFI